MQISKLTLYISLILSTTIVLIISELIYIYNNKPDYIALGYFWMARYKAPKNAMASLYYLEKGAKYTILSFTKTFQGPKYEHKVYITGDSKINDNFKSDYQKFMAKTSIISEPFATWKIAREFYSLGLLAYEHNENNLAKKFIYTASLIEPESSYYHIELANLFLQDGQKDETKNTLDFCGIFSLPKKHCTEYSENHYLKNYPLEVGFLKEIIYNSQH